MQPGRRRALLVTDVPSMRCLSTTVYFCRVGKKHRSTFLGTEAAIQVVLDGGAGRYPLGQLDEVDLVSI